MLRSTRARYFGGKVERETTYYITSVPRTVMGAEGLGKRVRTHWGIENRLHHIRDVTFAEDASRLRTGWLPQIWAAVRNVAIFALRKLGASTIPAAIRYIAGFPRAAIEIANGSRVRVEY